MTEGVPIIFGGAGLKSEADIIWYGKALDVLEKHGVKILDSAKRYPNSEATIGKYKAGTRFTIDTKCGGTGPKTITKEGVIAQAEDSMKTLGVDQVDVFYIHTPDPEVPIEETLAGIDAVHKKGFFRRFGLSNYSAEQVQQVYDVCKANGYVLPTVYQGAYSAVQRKQETILFPTLRKLGISFYAYGPLAGGFLAKSREQVLGGQGRFSKEHPMAQIFDAMWKKPSMLNALDTWGEIAETVGCSRPALAARWMRYHSVLKQENGDALILGASSLEQLESTLNDVEAGPLPEDVLPKIDEIWKSVENESKVSAWETMEQFKKMKMAQLKAQQQKQQQQQQQPQAASAQVGA